MNRLHALLVSVVLGATGAVGVIAATQTMHLGAASAAPAQTDRAALRARTQRLNTWAKALNSSLAKRPPALPRVPQFGPVAVTSYSTEFLVAGPTTAPSARQALALKVAKNATRSVRTATKASRSGSTPPKPTPGSDDPPATETTTTTQATNTVRAVAPVAAPAPPPVPTSAPPTNGDDDTSSDDSEPEDPPEPGDDG